MIFDECPPHEISFLIFSLSEQIIIIRDLASSRSSQRSGFAYDSDMRVLPSRITSLEICT